MLVKLVTTLHMRREQPDAGKLELWGTPKSRSEGDTILVGWGSNPHVATNFVWRRLDKGNG